MNDRARMLEDHEITDPETWQDHWRLHQPNGRELHEEHMVSMGKLAANATAEEMLGLSISRGVSIGQVIEARRLHIEREAAKITVGPDRKGNK